MPNKPEKRTKWELFTYNKNSYISLGYYVTKSIVEAEMEAVRRAEDKGISVPSVSVIIVQEDKK